MIKVKDILVPIDFSSSCYRAFEVGHCLAQHNYARLHLIHVIDPIYNNGKQIRNSDSEFVHEIRYENAKEELQKFKFEVPHSDVEITEFLIEGTPHKEILLYARQNDINMIVISSHGWTNLPHKLMGSVADKIMRQADVPVICIKSNLPVVKNRELKEQDLAENWIG